MTRHQAMWAGLSLLLLVTGCQSATAAGTRDVTRVAAPQSMSPSLVTAARTHSQAAATALADAALDQVSFPAGATRLPVRPALGTANLDQDTSITSRAVRTRWWSVPGTVADVAAYLVAHPPNGLLVTTQGTLYVWSAAVPLAFDMDAYLVQDGTAVDVSLGAEATWTPAKTAIEIIPASVTHLTLDYYSPMFNGLYPPMGADRRRLITGAPLAQIRDGINALETPPTLAYAPSCPADNGEQATLTMQYEHHLVVDTIPFAGCDGVTVNSDGKLQPVLDGLYSRSGPALTAVMAVIHRLAQAPVTGTVAKPYRGSIYTARAADARATRILDGLIVPAGTTKVIATQGGNLYEDRNSNYLTRSRRLHVPLARPALLTYLEAHVPAGTVIAHLGTQYGGDPQLVEQLAGAYPSPVALTITLEPAGEVRLEATAQWSASRSPQEMIPAATRSALLTIEPYQGSLLPARRVQYTGPALSVLISWLNARPAKVYTPPCTSSTAKVGATFRLQGRVVTFYTEDSCSTVVVVNRKAAPWLAGSFATIVERLLKVRP